MPGPGSKTRQPRATVVAGVAYELLVLLYRQVQASHGLPPPPAAAVPKGLQVPARLHAAADWFFRGDIALGMNLLRLVHQRGWTTAADLADGVATTGPHDLAQTMLQPPDATQAAHHRRARQVAAALAGRTDRTALLQALARERFDTDAAAMLLDDPAAAARAFTQLIRAYARAVQHHQAALEAALGSAAQAAAALLGQVPLAEAIQRLCPRWKLGDLAAFRRVVLIPSPAITPFLSTRITRYDQALIVFPVPGEQEHPIAELAQALKAIGDPQRLEILRLAMAAPITGHTLARTLGLTEATIHHHTSLLRAAGLLVSTRTGNRVYHASQPQALERLLHATIQTVRPGDETHK